MNTHRVRSCLQLRKHNLHRNSFNRGGGIPRISSNFGYPSNPRRRQHVILQTRITRVIFSELVLGSRVVNSLQIQRNAQLLRINAAKAVLCKNKAQNMSAKRNRKEKDKLTEKTVPAERHLPLSKILLRPATARMSSRKI